MTSKTDELRKEIKDNAVILLNTLIANLSHSQLEILLGTVKECNKRKVAEELMKYLAEKYLPSPSIGEKEVEEIKKAWLKYASTQTIDTKELDEISSKLDTATKHLEEAESKLSTKLSLEDFKKAHDLFTAGKYKEAYELFTLIRKNVPEDVDRCELYDEMSSCGFYVDKTESKQYFKLLLSLARDDSKAKEYVQEARKRLLDNCSYYEDDKLMADLMAVLK